MTPLPTHRPSPWLIIGMAGLTLAVGLSGYFYYRQRTESVTREKQAELAAIANLKVDQLILWLSERNADGLAIRSNPLIIHELEDFVGSPRSAGNVDMIRAWMRGIERAYGYTSSVLTDTSGRPLLMSKVADVVGDRARRGIAEAVRDRKIVLTPMHRRTDTSGVRMNLIVPLERRQGASGPLLAVLVLRIDPVRALSPILSSWPVETRTSESYLVRIVGDSVQFLTTLRYADDPPLTRFRSLASMPPDLAAAFRRGEGIINRPDYRGRLAMGSLHAVPSSEWILVAKTDADEVFASLQRELIVTLLMSGLLFVALLTTIGFWWRSRRADYYREQLIAEREREEVRSRLTEAEERFRNALRSSPTGLHFYDLDTDDRLIFQGSNETADRMIKIAGTDLVGRTIEETVPGLRGTRIPDLCRAVANGSVPNRHFEVPYEDATNKATYDVYIFQISPRSIAVNFIDITERKQAEMRIRTSEEQYRLLADNVSDVIWILDPATQRFTYVSPSVQQLRGFSAEEVMQQSAADVMTPRSYREMTARLSERLEAVRAGDASAATSTNEVEQICKNGSIVVTEVVSRFVQGPGGHWQILAVSRDMTQRKEAERSLMRMNRLLAFVSEINQLIVRSHDVDELLRDSCRIAVEVGQFQYAWIGRLEPADGSVHAVAANGADAAYLDDIRSRRSSIASSHGPTGTAIREQRHVVINDFSTVPATELWRDDAIRRGLQSAMGVPMRVQGKPYGAVTFYSAEAGYFAPDEVDLLIQVAGDIAFAIETIRNEEVRRQKEAELHLKDIVFETSISANTIADQQGSIMQVNQSALRLWGYADHSEVIGKPLRNFIQSPEVAAEIAQAVVERQQWVGEYKAVRKDGTTFDAFAVATVIRDVNGRFIGFQSSVVDVTERKRSETLVGRLSQALEQASTGVMITDLEGTIEYVNAAEAKNTGYRVEELVGKHADLLSAGPPDQTQFRTMWETIAAGKTWKGEFENRRKDGTVFWEANTITPIRDGRGTITHYLAVKEDITERKRILEDLRIKEAAIASSPTGIALHTLDGRYTTVNGAFAAMFGYASPDEFVGRHVSEFPEFGAVAGPAVEEVRKTGFWSGEVPGTRKDGRQIFYQVTASFVRDESGAPMALLALFNEITERKQAEEQLRKSEETFRTLFETMAQGVVYQDGEGRILSANPAAQRMLGLTLDQMQGRTSVDPRWRSIREDGSAFPGEEHPAMVALRTGKPVGSVVMGVEHPVTETTNWLNITALPLFRVGEPRPYQVYTVFDDITERRQADERIRQSEDRMRLAIETTRLGVWEWHLATNKIRWDMEMFRLYGQQPTADGVVDYADWATSMTPEELARQEAALQETIRLRGKGQREFQIVQKDSGKRRDILAVETVRLNSAGEPEWVIGTNLDITERKQVETQQLRAQRMESIGTLAGGIAHDLNNMLGPILLSLDYLRNKLTDDRSKRMLEMMEQSASRGADLIKQVLSFARGSEGDHAVIQARHIINDVKKIIEQTFPKTIAVEVQAPRTLSTVLADATQIHQVLMNLCVNARDAMPNGGVLTVKAENAAIDDQYAKMQLNARAGHFVVISVSDTGTGIPPEIRDRIFDPFFTTKEQGKGTGLGLATVQTIVQSHQGFLNVYSEVGKGTTFRIYLPVAENAGAEAEVAAVLKEVGHGETLLVVDDELALREITSATLEGNGYRVLTASDGAEAVAVFAQHRADIKLVLVDMMMPHMDGPNMIRIIERMDPFAKFLAVSGLKHSSFIGQIPDGVAFIQKPYTADALLKKVREVLERTV